MTDRLQADPVVSRRDVLQTAVAAMASTGLLGEVAGALEDGVLDGTPPLGAAPEEYRWRSVNQIHEERRVEGHGTNGAPVEVEMAVQGHQALECINMQWEPYGDPADGEGGAWQFTFRLNSNLLRFLEDQGDWTCSNSPYIGKLFSDQKMLVRAGPYDDEVEFWEVLSETDGWKTAPSLSYLWYLYSEEADDAEQELREEIQAERENIAVSARRDPDLHMFADPSEFAAELNDQVVDHQDAIDELLTTDPSDAPRANVARAQARAKDTLLDDQNVISDGATVVSYFATVATIAKIAGSTALVVGALTNPVTGAVLGVVAIASAIGLLGGRDDDAKQEVAFNLGFKNWLPNGGNAGLHHCLFDVYVSPGESGTFLAVSEFDGGSTTRWEVDVSAPPEPEDPDELPPRSAFSFQSRMVDAEAEPLPGIRRDPGWDDTVDGGDTVTLDAGATIWGDSEIDRYTWFVLRGPGRPAAVEDRLEAAVDDVFSLDTALDIIDGGDAFGELMEVLDEHALETVTGEAVETTDAARTISFDAEEGYTYLPMLIVEDASGDSVPLFESFGVGIPDIEIEEPSPYLDGDGFTVVQETSSEEIESYSWNFEAGAELFDFLVGNRGDVTAIGNGAEPNLGLGQYQARATVVDAEGQLSSTLRYVKGWQVQPIHTTSEPTTTGEVTLRLNERTESQLDDADRGRRWRLVGPLTDAIATEEEFVEALGGQAVGQFIDVLENTGDALLPFVDEYLDSQVDAPLYASTADNPTFSIDETGAYFGICTDSDGEVFLADRIDVPPNPHVEVQPPVNASNPYTRVELAEPTDWMTRDDAEYRWQIDRLTDENGSCQTETIRTETGGYGTTSELRFDPSDDDVYVVHLTVERIADDPGDIRWEDQFPEERFTTVYNPNAESDESNDQDFQPPRFMSPIDLDLTVNGAFEREGDTVAAVGDSVTLDASESTVAGDDRIILGYDWDRYGAGNFADVDSDDLRETLEGKLSENSTVSMPPCGGTFQAESTWRPQVRVYAWDESEDELMYATTEVELDVELVPTSS